MDPSSFAGGPLEVNVGQFAGDRGSEADPTNTDEMVDLTGSNYNATTNKESITVKMFGASETYNNVNSIIVPGMGGNIIVVDPSVMIPVNISAGNNTTNKQGFIIDNGQGGGKLSIAGDGSVVEAGTGPETITDTGTGDTIVTGGRSSTSGGSTPPTPQPETVNADGSTTILWNSDFGPDVQVNGANGTSSLWITSNDSQSTAYSHGEDLTINQTSTGTTLFSHVTVSGMPAVTTTIASISVNKIPAVYLSAPGGNNQISIGNLVGSGISTLDISYGSNHTAADSLSLNGSTGNDQFTLTTGTGTLFNVPAPVVPDPFPSAGTTGTGSNPPPSDVPVNTTTIAELGGTTIELLGTSGTAQDSLSINGKGGNDTFYVTAININTTLQGEDGNAVNANPIATLLDIGFQGLGAPGILSGINAQLTITGTASVDTALFDDSADLNDANYEIDPNTFITNTLGTNGSVVYNSFVDNFVLLSGQGENNVTVKNTGASGQTSINGGGGDNNFVVNGPLTTAPGHLNGGGSLTGADTLTINAAATTNTFVISPTSITGDGAPINYVNLNSITLLSGGGNDSFTLNGVAIPLTIQGSNGNDTFIVNSVSAPTTLDGGPNPADVQSNGSSNAGSAAGNDTFIINGVAGPLTINGFDGSDLFTINANASTTVINGGNGQDVFTVNGNASILTLNGGPLLNTFNINSNSSQLTINNEVGGGIYDINNTSSPITINGSSESGVYRFARAAPGPCDHRRRCEHLQFITITGTPGGDNFTVTTSAIEMTGGAITYSGGAAITINGNGGNDTFTLVGNTGPTTFNGVKGTNAGHETFNIQTANFAVAINSGSVSSTINVGSRAPIETGGNLDGITAALTINGSGSDTVTLDDSASPVAKNGVLTNSFLTGWFGPIGLTYSGLSALNLNLGSQSDSLIINSTFAATTTTINTGVRGDTLNIQSAAGPLNINAAPAATAPNTYNINGAVIATNDDSFDIVEQGGKLFLQGSSTPLAGVADFSTSQLAAELSPTAVTVPSDLVTAFAALGITLTAGSPVTVQTTSAGTKLGCQRYFQ